MKPVTLGELLRERSSLAATGITFIEGSSREEFLSYKALYDAALKALSYIQSKGLQPKDELIIQIEDNKSFIIVFWACIAGGIIPVPLSIGKNDEHKQKLFNVWPLLNNPYLVTAGGNLDKLGEFARQTGQDAIYSGMTGRVIDEADILASDKMASLFEAKEDQVAFIQFSSGSTGNPKGVVLTHKNLLTNIGAISKAARYTGDDSLLSWMPLTHDMGLIGFHLNPLYAAVKQYLMPPGLFIRMPALWMDKASEHKATVLCSPNFGYNYFNTHVSFDDPRSWDLSRVRIVYNGAEPISVKIAREFLDRLSVYGLKSNAMRPVYGLAEASLAVSFSELGDEVLSLDLDRNSMNLLDRVADGREGDNPLSIVNVGRPVEHCLVRVSDYEGNPVAENVIGYIQIKGDNVTSGYYNNAAETHKIQTHDGWLQTGDLGFTRDGALYVTGRAKDILFVNGQNYYPHDIERIAEEIEGIELNKVAVAGLFNAETQKEEILAFVLHRGKAEEFIPLIDALKAIVTLKAGLQIDKVIPVKEMARTTSGKLQRFKLLEKYKSGGFRDILNTIEALKRGEVSDRIAGCQPENDTEEKILAIWQKLLEKKAIGVEDNFFALGGNSLKAAEMSMMLLKEFQVDMSLEVIYEKQTIRGLAHELKKSSPRDFTPIPVLPRTALYPVSSVQRRLYYYWVNNKSSIAYNIPVAFRIEGEINSDRLESCIRQLIRRHDSLRMSFVMAPEPSFTIQDDISFSLDAATCSRRELDLLLQSLVRPFDLGRGPLFRGTLIMVEQSGPVLMLDFHHIISDGLSVYHFIRELISLYGGAAPAALPVQYRDFVHWEAALLQPENLERSKQYWMDQLGDELPVLEMPLDHPRPVIFDTAGKKTRFTIDALTAERLRRFAGEQNCTLHVLLFTIYNVLLSKYTGQEDIISGIPVAGRMHPDLLDVQGMFVNNLAIRNNIQGDMPFVQLLEKVRIKVAAALKDQYYPFDELVREAGGKRDMSRNPLFDTMFIYQNMGFLRPVNNGPGVSEYFFDPGFSKFDLSVEVFEKDGALEYAIEHASALFKDETIARLAAHFDHLITGVIDNPGGRIADLKLMNEGEYDEIIRKYNDTDNDRFPGTTIHRLFEEQVERFPDSIAIEYSGGKMTCRELNDKAECLAGLLRSRDVTPDTIVGILLFPSPELIIAILAVLKAGGCYLPVEPDLPEERIRFLMADSRCRLIISGDEIIQSQVLKHSSASIINIDEPIPPDYREYRNEHPSGPGNLAYLIYTSGTTGNPKGVMIEHGSLVNYITWAAEHYTGNGKAAFPLFTSVSFDLTVTSIFTPLITGNTIVIYRGDGKSMLIEKVVRDNKTEVIKLTPSHLKILAESEWKPGPGTRIKRFIVGGEKFESSLALSIYRKFHGDIEIYNEYGPTEATVGCMIHLFDPDNAHSSVPIGIPAANTRIYILDKYLVPVPEGVHGELYISGKGIARGYLFNKEATRQKFIADPFAVGNRMYKTGDIARWLPGGIIEYIGRQDCQVKINGYRIELSEIEHQLTGFPGLTEVLVITRPDKKDRQYLCAYYKSRKAINGMVLRNYLADRLPYYMIPAYFIRLDEIPLTKNGKVDRQALPEPEMDAERTKTLLPENQIEELSKQVWEEVLGVKDIRTTDSFFELGGDSIKAVQVVSRLFEKGISLTAKNVLTYNTIAQISLHAEITGSGNGYQQGIVEGPAGLTPAASWFFGLNLANPHYYNQSLLLSLKKEINTELLQKAFSRLVEHHDSLRINYDQQVGALYYNRKYADEGFVIGEFDVTPDDKECSRVSGICRMLKASFDIRSGLLLKAAIIKGDEEAEMLFITAHHLLMDGISWRILLEDLVDAYTALERQETPRLPQKTATLPEWEERLRKYGQSGEFIKSKTYWDGIGATGFAIPLDHIVADWTCANMKKRSGSLTRAKTSFLLKEAHQAYKTDVPMLLNTALARVLKKWTGSEILVIEQEGHGRYPDDINISRTLGWFTAFYPLRVVLKEELIGDQIKAVKEQVRAIPDHGVGYGVISSFRRGSDPGPMSGIRLNYLGQFDQELDNELFCLCRKSHGMDIAAENNMTARLELNVMVIGGILNLEICYNSKAHKTSTVDWLIDEVFDNLDQILEHIKGEDQVHLSPSDFDAAGLSQEELDALFQ